MRVVNTPRQTLFSCESERNQEIIANSKKDDTVSESFKELIYLIFVMKCATKSNKVIRPKSRVSALSIKVTRTDRQTFSS